MSLFVASRNETEHSRALSQEEGKFFPKALSLTSLLIYRNWLRLAGPIIQHISTLGLHIRITQGIFEKYLVPRHYPSLNKSETLAGLGGHASAFYKSFPGISNA